MTVKILAVDDSATMRKILGMTFAGEDAVVVTASSAEEALAKARQAPPDVVFADAALGGTDGYALATALKSDPALANTAVILLASQHHPFDEGKGRASGVDDHVAKPFDTQVVLDKVADVLRRPRARASAPAMAAVAAAPVASTPAATPPAPPAPTPSRLGKQTMAFGSPPAPPPPAPPAAKPVLELADEEVVPGPAAKPVAVSKPAPAPAPARTFAAPAKPAPAPAAAPVRAASRPAVVAAAAVDGGMAAKLEGLGLTKDQIEGVLALSREVVEQVVWEVVPELAETLIREEIQRLTRE